MAMIPKKIFTIWISEIELPEKYKDACKTHEIEGYEHQFINLENCFKDSQYLREAINAKKWIKVTDYLRMHYLYEEGGIYLDCDMSVIKPFDKLLDNQMFVGRESEQVIANSIIGAEKGHLLLKKYIETVEGNFRGNGDFIFEPAERLFSDLVLGHYGNLGGVVTYSTEYFFPFNEAGQGEITNNSYTNHGFTRSWK